MNERSTSPALGSLVAQLARINCALWHEEDKARGESDKEVAAAKRAIDSLNQERNDAIEAIDSLVVEVAQAAQGVAD